jgi:O-acetyl-ADP-ribose deacetylase (regulator of RNase III)
MRDRVRGLRLPAPVGAQPAVKARIEVVQGDIARERVDAVVAVTRAQSVWAEEDPADDPTGAGILAVLKELAGEGVGVDAAIRLAGGPELAEQVRRMGYVAEGDAKATTAGALPARHVIHTATPAWRGGSSLERQKLAWCYRSSLELARALGCGSVAFPPLGTGAARFPLEIAAELGAAELKRTLDRLPSIRLVRIVCAAPWLASAYRERLEALGD